MACFFSHRFLSYGSLLLVFVTTIHAAEETLPPTSAVEPAILQEARQKLTAFPETASIRRAVLDWALMECQRLQQEGDESSTSRINALAQEVIDALQKPTYGEKKQEPKNLFPLILAIETNHGAKDLFEIKAYVQTNPLNPKKSGRPSNLGDADALQLAYAALHPQSPNRGNSQAIIAMLTSMNQSWCIRKKESWGEHSVIMAYILFQSVYPDLIPQSIRKEWTNMMRTRSDRQIEISSRLFAGDYVSRSWLNGDIRNIMHVGFAGIALDDPKYRQWMDHAVSKIFLTLQPDGATNYTGYQNEASLYHDAAVECLAWYWLFSRNQQAFDFVARASRFYALAAQRYICEEYTAPEQKHYYNGNQVNKTYPGYFAKDPFAVAACQAKRHHLTAFTYDPSLPTVTIPDRFTLFDRNVIGPRGRYGNLDFAISTRDFSYYPGKTDAASRTPTNGFGVTTFLGMRLMNPPDFKGWPLHAVVERIMNNANVGKHEFDKGELIQSSVSMAQAASAVSADYMTSGREGQNWNWGPLPFTNTQAWIVDGERAVGFMRIQATEVVKDARMSTTLEFVSGRAPWGQRKQLITREKGLHEYGDFRLRVVATSYQAEDISYTKGGLSGNDNMRAVFRLVEKPGEPQARRIYQRGEEEWCLIELRPASSAPATSIKMIPVAPNLHGFSFEASGKSFTLVHNPNDHSVLMDYAMPESFSQYSLHLGTDGKITRDRYLNLVEHEKARTKDHGGRLVKLPNHKVSFSIPPHRHVLILGSNDATDHQNGFQFYEDVFSQ